MDYQILERDTAGKLAQAVKAAVADGWNLCGGVSICSPGVGSGFHFAQAMTKDDGDGDGEEEGPLPFTVG